VTPSVSEARLLELPRIETESGWLTPVHGGTEVPFDIARVFYLYDIPAGAHRGGHAHRVLEQVVVAVMGSISVELDDGREKRTVDLRQPDVGLHIPPMLWSELVDFASGSIAVVLASVRFDEEEYVRDHAEYLTLVSPDAARSARG
jgi:WxcM-like, C-terminal